MNKQIAKYISIVVSFIFFAIFLWLLFIYAFLSGEVKKTIYPVIENSKQLLSEVITKDFATDKIQKLVFELKKNQYISAINVINNKNSIYERKVFPSVLSLAKFSYKIKKEQNVVGYIEIFPSFMLLEKLWNNVTDRMIITFSLIFLLVVIITIIIIYTQRFIFYPYKQIKNTINSIISNENINIEDTSKYGLWNNIFYSLNKLNNKVFNIDITIELLAFISSIVKSELELVNLMHIIFNMIQQKFRNSMCALLLYDNNGQLKIVAKNASVVNNIAFVINNPRNYTWKSYTNNQEFIVNDKKYISKESLGELYDESISSFMLVPLVNNDKKCIGVFAVANKVENSFDSDIVEIIRSASKYIVLLINRMNDYKQIKKINKSLETEKNYLVKELECMNNLLINKESEIKSIVSIANYVSNKNNLEDCLNYISEKIKDILNIEKFGILEYDSNMKILNAVRGSFDIDKDLQIKCKKDTIYSKIIDSNNYMILNNSADFDSYSNMLYEYIELKSLVLVPVKKCGKVIALMVAINKIDGIFNYSDVKVLDYIATIIYAIIDRKI